MKTGLVVLAALFAPIVGNAALISVTQNGDLMVNDSALNVTWADVASPQNALTWSAAGAPGSAQAWVASLNTEDYGGYNNWTLPTGSQLNYLFTVELGDECCNGLASTSPFQNALTLTGAYWSSTVSSTSPTTDAVNYDTGIAQNEDGLFADTLSAIAVRPGQVLPLPAAGWLLLSGLGGMGLFARKRAKRTTSDA
jgi:hypothetical protein